MWVACSSTGERQHFNQIFTLLPIRDPPPWASHSNNWPQKPDLPSQSQMAYQGFMWIPWWHPQNPAPRGWWLLPSVPSWYSCTVHKLTHLLSHFFNHLYQLSCSVHIPIDDKDFPNGESAIYGFVFVCLFTFHWVMVPGTGITRKRRREPSHIAAHGKCKSSWKPRKKQHLCTEWQGPYVSALLGTNIIEICSYWGTFSILGKMLWNCMLSDSVHWCHVGASVLFDFRVTELEAHLLARVSGFRCSPKFQTYSRFCQSKSCSISPSHQQFSFFFAHSVLSCLSATQTTQLCW